jgi:hypothetical protein
MSKFQVDRKPHFPQTYLTKLVSVHSVPGYVQRSTPQFGQ